MDVESSEQKVVDDFLRRVLEIEEKYSYSKRGQESSRKEELRKALEDSTK